MTDHFYRLRAIVHTTFARSDLAHRLMREVAEATDDSDARARVLDSHRLLRVAHDMPEALYPLHVRELLARRVAGEDTRPATDAEIVMAMSEISAKAPPSAGMAYAMASLMAPHFPVADMMADWRETWPGERDEIVGEFRRKLASPERK